MDRSSQPRPPLSPKPRPPARRSSGPGGPTAPLAYRHAKVQRLRRLIGRRSVREAERAFVLEGPTMLGEALAARAPIEALFVPADASPLPEVRRAWDLGVRVYDLEPGVLERVAETVTPQPVLAIVGFAEASVEAMRGPGPVVVCVDVRDPGNLGTVVRSAEAAGAAGVICCDGTVDVYNPKCVRASAGALFHVPILTGASAVEVLPELTAAGRKCLGSAVGAGDVHTEAALDSPVAFVMGNEANGIPAALVPAIDGWIHIPIEGRSESLNVGVACAVLCFEAGRQRGAVAARGLAPGADRAVGADRAGA